MRRLVMLLTTMALALLVPPQLWAAAKSSAMWCPTLHKGNRLITLPRPTATRTLGKTPSHPY